MTKMLVKLMLPISIIEKPAWKEYIEILDPSYSMPRTRTIQNTHLTFLKTQVLDKVKAQVNSLEWVNVSVDGWPDATMRGYNGYIAQGIDQNWELHSIPIAFEFVVGSHTGEAIKSQYDLISREFNLEHKTFKIVADQGKFK